MKRDGRKLIAVGDQTTLNLLNSGIKPHLAVCDFRIKRKQIASAKKRKIRAALRTSAKYTNMPGTLSEKILRDAKKMLKKGGLVEIMGEEDLTALAFILNGNNQHSVLYGQPNVGLVVVKPENKKIKKRIKAILSIAFRHEIKG
jgi:uncharacterized protein (UPF0218 family)